MSFKMPSTEQVRELGDSLGIGVTDSYANSFIDFIKPFADGYRLIASLSDDVPEIKYPRGGYYRPEGEENKHGAWIAKAHIRGASNGKLVGKKVAVKDTYALAGVPLTNDMATGDQARSIRIPASLSGVVGIRPTWGRVPYTGIKGDHF